MRNLGETRRSGAAVFVPFVCGALACGAFLVPPAQSGQWRVTPTASMSTTFSDNANAANDGTDRNSDLVTTLSPGIGIAGTGGRVSLNLAYSYDRFISMQDTSDETASHSLIANGQAELYDRVAFVNYTSSVSRQVIDSSTPVSSVDTGSNVNRTTVRTASLQPFFLHHFGTYLETESRYIFDYTETDSSTISTTRSAGEQFSFNSGRRFSVFTFSGNLNRDKTIRDDGAPSTTSTDATTNYRLRVHRTLSLLASAGWQNVDDPTLEEEIKGFTWNVGFAAQPNSASSIELTYGREFNTDDINLNASYALSSRTTFTADYSETLTTSEEILSEDLSFVVDNGFGVLIDSRTGQVFDPANPNFDFQNSLFRRRLLALQLNMTRRRNTYAVSLDWERRKDEATDLTAKVISIGFDFSRTINSRLSATVSTSIAFDDQGTADGRKDQRRRASAALTYQLMKNTNASLTYQTSRTSSNLGENDFRDNVLTLTLNHQF